MTLNGAIKQLYELRSAEDMPVYYKPAIAEVINVLLMDAVERKKGKWIEKEDGWGGYYYDCSVCKESWTTIDGTPWDNGMNFCSHCGADMRGEEHEDIPMEYYENGGI